MFDFQEELKKLPQRPGVYIMRDKDETVIYVGKAINLKNRVRSYFQDSNANIPKIKSIRANIANFEYIVAANEVEALILENNLIKKYRPKYNVLLKNDKTYPYIKITVNEPFPRASYERRREKDKAKYYGPYTSSESVFEMLELMHKLWPLRRCTKKIEPDGEKTRPCLNYHIGLCKAPCNGLISREEYGAIAREVGEFLNGRHNDIVVNLQNEMIKASEALDFENAAALRDRIAAVKKLRVRQKIETMSCGDNDIIAYAVDGDTALAQVFFMRDGKMLGREQFMLEGVSIMSGDEIMTAFITQFYSGTPFIPKEIVIQHEISDINLITEWLSEQKESKVTIHVPQKGDKHKLLDMAAENASLALRQFGEQLKREKQRTLGALNEIKQALQIDIDMERIEAYDISNIQGFESVASMIVFEQGKPKRSDYRKFKIKAVSGANDYASMEEVLSRRFKRYELERDGQMSDEKKKFSKLPDIIFADGGKPQVSAVESVLKTLGIAIPVCGMIKDDRHKTRGLLFGGREITMPFTSEGFKLVTRIQDEVHRFAIEYHKSLRQKSQIRSVLDEIKGVGATRRIALIKHFGDIEGVKAAGIDELSSVDSMNIKAARAVYDFFHNDGGMEDNANG